MRLFKRSILFFSIFIGTITIFYLPYREIRTKTIESIRNEQYMMTVQASRGIERFFDHYTKLLRYFSKIQHIININDRGKSIMRNLYINHSEDLLAVTRIDAQGTIIYTVPYDSTAGGKNVSYQLHNKKIIETHQPVVSDIFTAVQGYGAVAYAYPIFEGNVYKGSLSILIPFKKLAQEHLAGVESGGENYAWIFSQNGTIIYSSDEELIGRNVEDSYADNPSVSSFIRKVLSSESGEGYYRALSAGNKTSPKEQIAFFAPSRVPGNTWYTVVSVPEGELYSSLNEFRNKWLVIFTMMLTAAFVVSYYLIEARKIVKEERKRKEAEEALRESEEKYRELTELAPQTVFEAGLDGRITYLNKFGFEMTGYSTEDLKNGLKIPDLCKDGDGELSLSLLISEEKSTEAGIRINECTLSRKDGGKFDAIIYSTPLTREGELRGLRGIIIDISERKKAEEERKRLEAELRHAHKMEALGRFAGGIAHDFNNILSAVMGYTDLSLMNIEDPGHVKENLTEIAKAAHRAKDLIQQIMTFSRKADHELEPVKLDELVEDAFKILRPSIPESIEIVKELGQEVVTVLANLTQIHQVLFNLCSNAIHAMNNKGTLRIAVRNVDVSRVYSSVGGELKPGRYAEISISDTGVGMDDETIERIFEPFFTTKDVGKGVGMGLSVVHGIVEGHGGTVRVESEPGKGTTFYVLLPEARVTRVDYSKPSGEILQGSERILFVDDEEALADIGKRMLEELGYRVTSVVDSTAALNLFKGDPFNYDLLVTDQIMPGMTGYELIQEIREIRPEFPAVICTGYSTVLSREKIDALGKCELVMKPIDMRKIAMVVRKVLDENFKPA